MVPNGRHIYTTSSDMVMAKMCEYPPSQYILPHCKYVLHCFSNCPSIDLPYHESFINNSNKYNSIRFNIYHVILRYTVYGRHPLDEKKNCCLCLQEKDTLSPVKLYIKKDFYDRDVYCRFSQKFLYSRNPKDSV